MMSSPEEKKPLGPSQKEKRCIRCSADFICGPAPETGKCWCAELPPIKPLTDEGCLCPDCLRREIAGRL